MSRHGLDWFTFFVANVHAGFGPFVSVYLVSENWTQADIGFVLAASGLVSLLGQIPGGALVDVIRDERNAAGWAMLAIGGSCVLLASWPRSAAVLVACLLYAAANCVLSPAIAAISLGLVGHRAMGDRLARNTRFSSIGSGLTTAGMGAIGYQFSTRSVFLLTAALTVPALTALFQVRSNEIDPARAHGEPSPDTPEPPASFRDLLANPTLLVLAGGIFLFHFANMPILMLFSGMAASSFAGRATLAIAAAVVISQLFVAAISPWVGRTTQSWGRRPLLLLSCAALMARAATIGLVVSPYMVITLQVIDGFSTAIFTIVVPLVISDVTRGTGHFNLTIGSAGAVLGLGASAGLALAGYASDSFGLSAAFAVLAVAAALALVLMWRYLPETRPASADSESEPDSA